jgi:hypothetical protein
VADAPARSLSEAGYRLMPFLRMAQAAGPGHSAASLADRLQRGGYAHARPSFAVEDLMEVLDAHPALLNAWLHYAEGKQSPDGWYVTRDAEVGQVSNPAAQRRFPSITAAVAQFILREWDFQAGLEPAGAAASARGHR